jgi:predicted phage terminase large subunit-like protein
MNEIINMYTMSLLDAACRTDLTSFGRKCFHTLEPGKPFVTNWHIEALAWRLEQVRRGEIKRLIINIPPRSLKSLMCSVAFPAYVLGHDPTKRLIMVSYGSDLAATFSNHFRAVISAQWYRRQFPAMQISRHKNTELEVVTTQHGYRLATSIDGTLTGRGCDIMVIDDPLKAIDALSDSKRSAVNAAFFNTFLSRLDDKQSGAIVVVMQRLHIDDLAGTLLRSGGWTPLILPAIAERDELIPIGDNDYHFRRARDPLQPDRESIAALESLRALLGSDTFAAQYQQAPIPPGGAMIKRDWVRYYDRLPETTSSTEDIQSWDTASKEGVQNDWSVCTTWLLVGDDYYLVDVLRDRMDYPTLRGRAIKHAADHRPNRIFVEDTGVGTGLITELKNERLPAIPVKPEHNKEVRMSVQSAKFESGHVFLLERASWLADLEAELFSFPNGRHDDQVDSISQALAHELPSGIWSERELAGLRSFTLAMQQQRELLPSRTSFKAMGIGGVQAYLLGLTG